MKAKINTKIFLENINTFKNSKNIKKIIFFAADKNYYNTYGKRLIKSISANNKTWGIHVHLYNPSKKTISELNYQNNLSYSYEFINKHYFESAYSYFTKTDNTKYQEMTLMLLKAYYRIRFSNILAKLIHFNKLFIYLAPRKILIKHFQSVYFSCQRFIVLNLLVNKKEFQKIDIFALDADSLVNREIKNLELYKNYDISLIGNTLSGFAAGAIYMPCKGRRTPLMQEFSKKIKEAFAKYELEWGLDQNVLNTIVKNYNWGMLRENLICRKFIKHSMIWMAYGLTKHNNKFLSKQIKSQ